MRPLIEAAGVSKHFPFRTGGLLHRHTIPLRAVDDVGLRILSGETLGLVGESGCGKSTLGRLLIRLIPPTAGKILFEGTDITLLRPAELRKKRRAIEACCPPVVHHLVCSSCELSIGCPVSPDRGS